MRISQKIQVPPSAFFSTVFVDLVLKYEVNEKKSMFDHQKNQFYVFIEYTELANQKALLVHLRESLIYAEMEVIDEKNQSVVIRCNLRISKIYLHKAQLKASRNWHRSAYN